ncbi:MAG: hypothetical protein AAFQ67_02710 [Pseudomonadota bacterium]
MDRRGGVLAIILFVGCGNGPEASSSFDLNALRWISDDADAVAALTSVPAGCLQIPTEAKAQQTVLLGETLFRSPALLGGQAARAGLSCEACHRNGRDNPDFFFPGVSSSPGDADLTMGFFSPDREDGVFNPTPISDLADDGGTRLVDRTDLNGVKRFLNAQMIEEFDAPAPPEPALHALASYLRAIDPKACDNQTRQLSWRDDFADVERAVDVAEVALRKNDFKSHELYIETARAALGRLYERQTGQGVRDLLAEASLELADAALDQSRLADWRSDLDRLRATLGMTQKGTLYDPETLAAALNTVSAQ